MSFSITVLSSDFTTTARVFINGYEPNDKSEKMHVSQDALSEWRCPYSTNSNPDYEYDQSMPKLLNSTNNTTYYSITYTNDNSVKKTNIKATFNSTNNSITFETTD